MAITNVTQLCNKSQDSGLLPPDVAKLPELSHTASHNGVKLLPDLSAAAFRQKLTLELITWHRLRYLNTTGSGFISIERAIEGLVSEFNSTPRTALRQINEANGKFLTINPSNRGPVIQIYALKRVCQYLNTTLTDLHWRIVGVEHFNSTGKAKAQLYASIFKPKGIRANPVSRETITERTGLHKMQQRRYEQKAHIKRNSNYACYKDNSPLGEAKYKPVKQDIHTRAGGHYQVNKKLGNIYHTDQGVGCKGMLRRVNVELKRSCTPDEAPTLIKQFYSSFKNLTKAIMRRTKTPKEGYYLVNSGYRTIPGRLEWCYYAI